MRLFRSSGDLLADRRYEWAIELLARDDPAGAIDLLLQAIERAPGFAAAWFALGDLREASGDRSGAVDAFRQAAATDPNDMLGPRLRLARLDALPADAAMAPAYVRALFDQYAGRYDEALTEGLGYRAPALLRAAVERACNTLGRAAKFACLLDLGCGTGLAGAAFDGIADLLTGVDLSPGMIAQARAAGRYDRLETAELTTFLANESTRYDLIVAADVLVYVADLAPVIAAAARVLIARGLLAFTVETHAGSGSILGEKLRYAHGADHVRAALNGAGLALLELSSASPRTEAGIAVPGLLAVAQKI
jgi:predicted TPR repeat methyltransferase